MKKKKRNNKMLSVILPLIVGGAFGGFLGFGGSRFINVEQLVPFVIFFLIFLVLHIILHEGGHFLFGLLAGYKPISFRVFSFTLVFQEDGKKSLKRITIPGTAGQCLMEPPKETTLAPTTIYLLGGGLMNISLSLLAVLYMVLVNQYPVFLLAFVLAGMISGILNLFPYSFNDGATILALHRNPALLKCVNQQFYINAQLSKGVLLKSIDQAYFAIPEDADCTQYLYTTMFMYKYQRYLELGEFESAAKVIDDLWQVSDEMIEMHKMEVRAEKLFCLCAIENKPREAIELYETQLEKILPKIKLMDKKRIMMSYALFALKDEKLASQYEDESRKLAKTFPLKGVVKTELMLMDWMKEKV